MISPVSSASGGAVIPPELILEAEAATDICSRILPPPDQILPDFADRGDKCFVIGTSKSRKSFTALQTGLHIVAGDAGMPFGRVEEGMRVLYVNLEIRKSHFERRLQKMARGLGIEGEPLSRFTVAHCRGRQVDAQHVVATALSVQADAIILDPAYKLQGWDEKDVGPWLAKFDSIVELTRALLIVVHHEKKGVAGDRQAIDRGAGDGKMSRDYDCALQIAPQRDEPNDCVVYSQVQRNYMPHAPVVMRFENGAFIKTDLPPIEATSQSLRAGAGKREVNLEAIIAMVRDHGPYSKCELREILIREGCTHRSAGPYIDTMERLSPEIVLHRERKPGGRTMVCTPAQKAAMEAGER